MTKNVIDLPNLSVALPASEIGIMRLYEAIGAFDQVPDNDPYYRTIYFSTARIEADDKEFGHVVGETKQFGTTLGEHGIDGGTGGGPSLMAAFNEGILEGMQRKGTTVRSYGCKIGCYPDEKPNKFLSKAYDHQQYATRLHQFYRLGRRRSFVAAGLGGLGTLLEVTWIWQLLQARQLDGAIFVLVGDMWPPLLDWMREYMLKRRTIKEADLDLVHCVPGYDEAVPLILEHKAQFMKRLAAA